MDPGYLNVVVRRLRRKLGDDPERPRSIETVWGTGYPLHRPLLILPPEAASSVHRRSPPRSPQVHSLPPRRSPTPGTVAADLTSRRQLCAPWRLDSQVTVLRIDPVAEDAPLVVSRRPDGYLLTGFAAQVEAAVATGLLVPVAGDGTIGRR